MKGLLVRFVVLLSFALYLIVNFYFLLGTNIGYTGKFISLDHKFKNKLAGVKYFRQTTLNEHKIEKVIWEHIIHMYNFLKTLNGIPDSWKNLPVSSFLEDAIDQGSNVYKEIIQKSNKLDKERYSRKTWLLMQDFSQDSILFHSKVSDIFSTKKIDDFIMRVAKKENINQGLIVELRSGVNKKIAEMFLLMYFCGVDISDGDIFISYPSAKVKLIEEGAASRPNCQLSMALSTLKEKLLAVLDKFSTGYNKKLQTGRLVGNIVKNISVKFIDFGYSKLYFFLKDKKIEPITKYKLVSRSHALPKKIKKTVEDIAAMESQFGDWDKGITINDYFRVDSLSSQFEKLGYVSSVKKGIGAMFSIFSALNSKNIVGYILHLYNTITKKNKGNIDIVNSIYEVKLKETLAMKDANGS